MKDKDGRAKNVLNRSNCIMSRDSLLDCRGYFLQEILKFKGEIGGNMEKETYAYEKAINGYLSHVQRYKDWMNLYALFTGALFIGYYTMPEELFIEKMLILIIGLIGSFCWLGSFYGYYNWLISWTKILHYHESKYIEAMGKDDTFRVYSLVSEEAVKWGLSTQKITRIFIYCIVIGWASLLINKLLPNKDIWTIIVIPATVLLVLLFLLKIILLRRFFLLFMFQEIMRKILLCSFLLSSTNDMWQLVKGEVKKPEAARKTQGENMEN